jgi:hemerythrin superfamily protein
MDEPFLLARASHPRLPPAGPGNQRDAGEDVLVGRCRSRLCGKAREEPCDKATGDERGMTERRRAMGHGGNIIAELTADHRDVERLFEQIQAMAPGDPQRKEIADRFTIELVRHSVAEELYLYPEARARLDDGEVVAEQDLADHTRVERTLKRLEQLQVPNTEFNRLVDELVAEVRAHVAEEEQVLFPALADVCSPEELEQLGEAVRRAKERAPTRPHPAAPHTPPANRRLAPGIGLVDRARDAVSGRGRGR